MSALSLLLSLLKDIDLTRRLAVSVSSSLIRKLPGPGPLPAQVSPDGLRYFGGTFLPFNDLPDLPFRA